MSNSLQRAAAVILILLAALLLAQAAFSLSWPIAHDEAPLLYEALLMQNGQTPYKDFFDFQMPGSYLFYYLLGLLSNFSPLRLRILDLAILAAVSLITYFAMRRFGKPSALAAPILFALKYLEGGPALSLQREYLILIFISLSIWIGVDAPRTFFKRLSLGLLYGLVFTLKPHAALGLVPFLLFDIADLRERRELTLQTLTRQIVLPAFIGFIIPISLIALYLAITHSLFSFISIALNYWRLYSQINGEMAVTPSAERTAYLLNQLPRLGGSGFWLIPAAFGIYLNKNRQTYLLASLALLYALYPALTGQFFPYHYIPFIYTIILVASLSINPQPSTPNHSLFPIHYLSSFILLSFILINIRPSQTFLRQLAGKPIATSSERSAAIADFLADNLEPGDQVQPLDWTGGALLAMLQTRAPLATSYVFDFYFYHHVSNPYIQSLRADFMNQLQESKPRFIVEVTSIDKPWVSGEDTSRDFPELRAFLGESYSVEVQREDYVIYERR
ncbi:MAG: hypothetical protein DCC59_07460 [Chloroflexi bacterium]|nr:hypothetical protein [Anaerolineales bacterium]RIK53345.1 MAG: hypothetical protein DCC59_07460 [Chloroflexota bacterium]